MRILATSGARRTRFPAEFPARGERLRGVVASDWSVIMGRPARRPSAWSAWRCASPSASAAGLCQGAGPPFVEAHSPYRARPSSSACLTSTRPWAASSSRRTHRGELRHAGAGTDRRDADDRAARRRELRQRHCVTPRLRQAAQWRAASAGAASGPLTRHADVSADADGQALHHQRAERGAQFALHRPAPAAAPGPAEAPTVPRGHQPLLLQAPDGAAGTMIRATPWPTAAADR